MIEVPHEADVAVGTITPSGNRTVERVAQAICRQLPGILSLHTRIPVHGVTKAQASPDGPYDWPTMLRAAELLGHAEPAAICWNGSKGGDYGFDIDRRLVADITAHTGRPAVTSALAVLDLLDILAARRIVLVTPYTRPVHDRSAAAFAGKGFDLAGQACAGIDDNLAYGAMAPAAIARLAIEAARDARAQAVVIFCTNFHGAPAAEDIERETGLPVIDSTAAGVWAVLKAAGVNTSGIKGFGRIFAM